MAEEATQVNIRMWGEQCWCCCMVSPDSRHTGWCRCSTAVCHACAPSRTTRTSASGANLLAGCAVLCCPSLPLTSSAVYILDDGKDVSKKAWVKNLGEDRVIYIPGHIKGENEINGKAHNLNNALGMIYPPGHEIPLEEVNLHCTKNSAWQLSFYWAEAFSSFGDELISYQAWLGSNMLRTMRLACGLSATSAQSLAWQMRAAGLWSPASLPQHRLLQCLHCTRPRVHALPLGSCRLMCAVTCSVRPPANGRLCALADICMVYSPLRPLILACRSYSPSVGSDANATLPTAPSGALQLLCVFDADMVCTAEFFLKTMPRIGDDKVSCLSPTALPAVTWH